MTSVSTLGIGNSVRSSVTSGVPVSDGRYRRSPPTSLLTPFVSDSNNNKTPISVFRNYSECIEPYQKSESRPI